MVFLGKLEGLYSDHPVDPGGETYRGISRVYWPDWPGWKIIDSNNIDNDVTKRDLDRLVTEFYRVNFWNRFQGDKVAEISQKIATELLECGVNLDVPHAVKILQEALNLLNLNQRLYRDIVIDGRLGGITLSALAQCLKGDKAERRLLRVMNVLQGAHYVAQMNTYPEKEIFRGWFDRV